MVWSIHNQVYMQIQPSIQIFYSPLPTHQSYWNIIYGTKLKKQTNDCQASTINNLDDFKEHGKNQKPILLQDTKHGLISQTDVIPVT